MHSDLAAPYTLGGRRSACIPFDADLNSQELEAIAQRIGHMPVRAPSAEQVSSLAQMHKNATDRDQMDSGALETNDIQQEMDDAQKEGGPTSPSATPPPR